MANPFGGPRSSSLILYTALGYVYDCHIPFIHKWLLLLPKLLVHLIVGLDVTLEDQQRYFCTSRDTCGDTIAKLFVCLVFVPRVR